MSVLALVVMTAAAAEYNVVGYGARPGGREDSAPAFLAACNDTGRSAPVVRVPAGTFLVSRAYFGGPCRSAAGVVVAVDGTVVAPAAVDMQHDVDPVPLRPRPQDPRRDAGRERDGPLMGVQESRPAMPARHHGKRS